MTGVVERPVERARRRARVGLAAKVAFLERPDSYPAGVSTVEPIETHMAWVFLASDLAYKLKKPVRHTFLDFSTIEARRRTCRAELRLNRRLAPDVYRRVVPLTVGRHGLRLGGRGRVVDWVVEMRRLPRERMLDRVIAAGALRDEDLRRVGRLLGDFYRRARPVAMAPARYRRRLRADVEANRRELVRSRHALARAVVRDVARAQLAFIGREQELLGPRAGRVVEAHGDLRPEHICLEDPPVIIDCLEFNREFRVLDPVDDLAYLGMECERLGAPQAGRVVLEGYTAASGDAPPEPLVEFYVSYRAYLRAKIAIWHTLDSTVPSPAAWRHRALEYLCLADAHASAWA